MKKKIEFNYFDEFAKSVELAKEITIQVKEYIYNFESNKSEEQMLKIHEIENIGDENLHKLKNFLLKDFLPPIDREDVLEIANKIDDLIDGIDEIAININILNITKIEKNMIDMICLLEKSINELHELMIRFKKLKNFDLIKEKIIEINKIEEIGDKMYENSIRTLYQTEKDAIQIIKWTKIYELTENSLDICEEIADCIEEVLMKNG